MTSKKQKEKIDEIGRKLIRSGALHENELDAIADGALFEGVPRRIESERPATRSAASPVWRRHLIAAGSMALFALISFSALYVLSTRSVETSLPAAAVDSAVTPEAPLAGAPQLAASETIVNSKDEIEPPVRMPEPQPQQAVYRQSRPTAPAVQRTSARPLPDAEFYAVTYTGDGGESVRGGRVVRMDVPRSTLFAMGMNIPLENESPTVKAELLIGPDGVTRAIRIVE